MQFHKTWVNYPNFVGFIIMVTYNAFSPQLQPQVKKHKQNPFPIYIYIYIHICIYIYIHNYIYTPYKNQLTM